MTLQQAVKEMTVGDKILAFSIFALVVLLSAIVFFFNGNGDREAVVTIEKIEVVNQSNNLSFIVKEGSFNRVKSYDKFLMHVILENGEKEVFENRRRIIVQGDELALNEILVGQKYRVDLDYFGVPGALNRRQTIDILEKI